MDHKPSDSLIVWMLKMPESHLNITYLRNSMLLSMTAFFEAPSVAALETIIILRKRRLEEGGCDYTTRHTEE